MGSTAGAEAATLAVLQHSKVINSAQFSPISGALVCCCVLGRGRCCVWEAQGAVWGLRWK